MKRINYIAGTVLAALLAHSTQAVLELKNDIWPFKLNQTTQEFKDNIVGTMTYSSWPNAPYIQFQPTFAFLYFWYNKSILKSDVEGLKKFFSDNSLSLDAAQDIEDAETNISGSKAAAATRPYLINKILKVLKPSDTNMQIYLNLVGLKVLYDDTTVINNVKKWLPASMQNQTYLNSKESLLSCFDWSDTAYEATKLNDDVLKGTLFATVGLDTATKFKDAIKDFKDNEKKTATAMDNLTHSLKTIASQS
ncbi:TPA: hypothetical protein DDZ86_02930 [Candidatus Dependentiae bacterium]|nr:MAG: hypothetical protein UW09_C0001G0059 [candidate division TM6 bacterium GW2011_GWF2_43_87]HBL98574.1 hypothetical protein [Candidatus Dependentiae bacterium]